ncbi:osmoprotectant transport system permease protein [Amycolatopsis jiangsuensis]|uniref:Osmoprotectant transport system permease protein n=1 Tax=Amycolatopsis jiangsuensis TaxID=1181879 RepID=A0A840IZQ8_9PSEU|nr:ABC transporter permease subunit [Amycolatopsis jiangsuensis]MBB4686648.1 osmoprotectant transport system permease protein [Amycolatopsis jiangsuensis]
MNVFTQLGQWLADPDRWSWTDPAGIPYRTVQHLWFSALALVIAALLTIPPALWLAHYRRGAFLASSAVNIGRAIPSFGLIILFWFLASRWEVDTDFWPLLLALVGLALPPLFTNTYAGVVQLDQEVVDAARGTGYRERQIMFRLELPLSSPVIVAGARVAFLQLVATVAIGAIVNDGGGLGRYIVDGFAEGARGYGEIFGGGIAVVVLALVCEGLFSLLTKLATPRGLALQQLRRAS